ncbi:hypothetical protein [Microbacterium sp. No. 7]|uniref:hypothetical protein n=1 Tax=Microbacterium sp. No. 7 TaxID=1714373 RepID=UPI0006D038DD|nr:hypothetical protein [Microbacterium sp. No. 7]ALJ20642.1 hypothetical protein AOA12_12325 [Microbacterium sp. No. 7]
MSATITEVTTGSARALTVHGKMPDVAPNVPVFIQLPCMHAGHEGHMFAFDRAELIDLLKQELDLVEAVELEASHFTDFDRALLGWTAASA